MLVNLTLVIPQPSIALPVWVLGVVLLFGGLALVIVDYLRRAPPAVAPPAAPAAEIASEPAAPGTTER